RPARECVTDDEYIISNLRSPLSESLIESMFQAAYRIVQRGVDSGLNPRMSSEESSPIPSNKLESDSKALLDKLIAYLRIRCDTRNVAPKCQKVTYRPPDDERVGLLVTHIKSIDNWDLRENQIVHLYPVLINILHKWFARKRQRNDSFSADMSFLRPFLESRPISLSKAHRKMRPSSNDSVVIDQLLETLKNKFLEGRLSLPINRITKTTDEFYGRLFNFSSTEHCSALGTTTARLQETMSISKSFSDTDDINCAAMSMSGSFNDRIGDMPTRGSVRGRANQSSSGNFNLTQYSSFVVFPQSLKESSSLYPDSAFSRPEFKEAFDLGGIRGHLVVHLHEHKFGSLSLATHPTGDLLFSASVGDGTIKFWDCTWPKRSTPASEDAAFAHPVHAADSSSQDIGRQSVNQEPSNDCTLSRHLPINSLLTYNAKSNMADQTLPVSCRGLHVTTSGQGLATLVTGREIHIVDASTGKLRDRVAIEHEKYGQAYNLVSPYVTSNQAAYIGAPMGAKDVAGSANWNLLAFATASSHIVGCDLRVAPCSSTKAFQLLQDHDFGLIRSLALHSAHTWLVSGTAYGNILNWDLRFQRPVSYTIHPFRQHSSVNSVKIYQVQPTDSITHTLLVTTHSRHNEISIWDMDQCTSSSLSSLLNGDSMYTCLQPAMRRGMADEPVGTRLAASWSLPEGQNACPASLPHIQCSSATCGSRYVSIH
ncbi:phosphoinositide-3-kinase, regulatory subunit 4, partial [Cichlidogyrus casuarinus]